VLSTVVRPVVSPPEARQRWRGAPRRGHSVPDPAHATAAGRHLGTAMRAQTTWRRRRVGCPA